MGNLLRDLRYSVRMLLNKPGFSGAAVIVLALGIGANTAVFSLVNAFLLKPLLIQKPEELVGCSAGIPTSRTTIGRFRIRITSTCAMGTPTSPA